MAIFIAHDTTVQFKLPLQPLLHTLTISTSGLHQEFILVTVSTKHSIIIGLLWMHHHNPQFFLPERDHKMVRVLPAPLFTMFPSCYHLLYCGESQKSCCNPGTPHPEVYHEFKNVLVKPKPVTCLITVLMTALLVSSQTLLHHAIEFTPLLSEQRAMEEHVQEALHKGCIQPSTLPALAEI